MPAKTESPFASSRCYLSESDVKHHLEGRYSSLIAPTGSCAKPKSPPRLALGYSERSLQVAVSPCWKLALPDVISAILAWLLASLRCSRPFLPRGHRPHPSSNKLGTLTHPAMQLQQGRNCRVTWASYPAQVLTRSGLGDFHHPAPPSVRLAATFPISGHKYGGVGADSHGASP
jgi:hypothetical protein